MRSVSAAVLLMAGAVSGSSDPCSSMGSCDSCVGKSGCGWCSTKIMYQDGSYGTHCAGPKYEKPFTCSGIYSSVTCTQGYVCDTANLQCKEAGPGQGVTKDECSKLCVAPPPGQVGYLCDQTTWTCKAASSGGSIQSVCELGCIKPNPVYKCDNATKKCSEVPPYTPGATDQKSCALECAGLPTPSPGPMPTVYGCNQTTFQCVVFPPYTPGSGPLDACQKACVKPPSPPPAPEGYTCDTSSYMCVKGGTKAVPKEKCEETCFAPNDPCIDHYSCTTCLAASPKCGWCSTNVTYSSGTEGTRCAGVGSGIQPFVCPGQYSTDKCIDGFKCDTKTGDCVDAGQGKGVPIDECRRSCKAPVTPAPAPAPTPAPYHPKCSVDLDLLFVLDGSASITDSNWQVDLECTKLVAENFTFGCGTSGQKQSYAKMGIIQFAGDTTPTNVQVEQHLTCSKPTFMSSLARVRKMDGNTATGDGMAAAQTEFKANGRKGDYKVVILITDGVPHMFPGDRCGTSCQSNKAKEVAKELKQDGADIFGVAVGQFDINFLEDIASSPSSKYVLNPRSWQELPAMLHKIIDTICP
eukprot:TRINITY_DN2695_c0_g1_i1.p1 TRINITY_DN2695_c0_g1~~TRINITY_DN2695_c0_g1_i1.p1  ORF type:complete len:579 (+),score=213.78 TRINITY_DN2695_c0_g1_i1:84-1820(+)